MNLEVFLPSQAKPDLNAKPGLSSLEQGDVSGGKSSSFLQILRPKTGLSDKPVNNDRVESKTEVSGTALHHAASTERPSRKPNKKTTKLFDETVAPPSQALKKPKKQPEEQSVPAVTLGQASQQVASKAKLITPKKQTGSLLGSLGKANTSSVEKGQAEKASRKVAAGGLSTVNAKPEAGLMLRKASTLNAHGIAFGVEGKGVKNTAKTEPVSNKENNPLAGRKIVKKRETISMPSSARSKSDITGTIAENERVQIKGASGIAAIPKAPNSSAGKGARINDRVVIPGSERISKTKTTGILQGAPSTRLHQIHKTVSTPGEHDDSYGMPNATKSPVRKPSKTAKPQPTLGQARRGNSIKSLSSKVSLAQSPKSPVNGVKIKFEASGQADNQSLTLTEKTAKGNQFLRPGTADRSLTVPASRERISTQNRTSVPDIPYPVKESIRQLNMLGAQEPKGNLLRNQTLQLTGLQTVASAKITPVLTGEKQKKTFKVAAKPASVRKPAKRTIAQGKPNAGGAKANAAGMEDAFLKLDMNLARKMEQPGNPRQNLPHGGQFASREVRNHASVAAEMLEAGRSDLGHIRDITVRNDFANRLNQVDVDLQSLQPKSTQTKGQTSVNAIVYRQVMSAVEAFRGMNTSRWAMTIEPFNNLRIQLDLRMSDSQLVVQAKLERGSQAVLGNGWSELQASLAEKDVDLRSLITGNQKEGHSYMSGGKNERQSDGTNRDEESWFSEELSELLEEFDKEVQKPGKAKRNSRKARTAETMFESWA